jgi:hypothetical protein
MGGRAEMALALLLSALLVSAASADSALNQTSSDAVVNTSLPLSDLKVEKPSDVVDKSKIFVLRNEILQLIINEKLE